VALVNRTIDILKNLGLETGQAEPGLVAFYDIQPGNEFFLPGSPHGAYVEKIPIKYYLSNP